MVENKLGVTVVGIGCSPVHGCGSAGDVLVDEDGSSGLAGGVSMVQVVEQGANNGFHHGIRSGKGEAGVQPLG